jgi:hypothetical protein
MMADTDDTTKTPDPFDPSSEHIARLQQSIEAERTRLLQVHSILHCLYEVLLYSDGEAAATYAEAAHLAAILIDDTVARLDPVKLNPLIEAVQRSARLEGRYELPAPKGLNLGTQDDDNVVREPRLPWPSYTH